jgi:type II secretory pathway component PulK
MKNKAQVLMFSLWILAILTVLSVSIGHRVSMSLRLSAYERTRIKAYGLALAGVKKAASELDKDTNNYDSSDEPWSTGVDQTSQLPLLKDISIREGSADTFTVGNTDSQGNYYCMLDEGSKIDINSAPNDLLLQLFNQAGITNNPQELANYICSWRGDNDAVVPENAYADTGYSNKKSLFSNTQELLLVKGMDRETYNALEDFITALPDKTSININTADRRIIDALVNYCIKKLEKNNEGNRDPETLVSKIMESRDSRTYFVSMEDLRNKLGEVAVHPGPNNILNELSALIGFKSACFYIRSSGKINGNIAYSIECVYDKQKNYLISWHER